MQPPVSFPPFCWTGVGGVDGVAVVLCLFWCFGVLACSEFSCVWGFLSDAEYTGLRARHGVVAVVFHNKNPPTPCLWQAPASTQFAKRKTRPAIRRSARWRAKHDVGCAFVCLFGDMVMEFGSTMMKSASETASRPRLAPHTTMHAQLDLYFTAWYGSALWCVVMPFCSSRARCTQPDYRPRYRGECNVRDVCVFLASWLLAFRNRRACDKKKPIIQRPPQSHYGTPQRPHAHPQSPNPACDRAAKKPAVKRSAAGRACCVRWWASRVPV